VSVLTDEQIKEKFDPLKNMPDRAPYKDKMRKLAEQAGKASWKSGVELMCIECNGWNRSGAKNCMITVCPLWQLNQRLFGPSDPDWKET